MGTGLIETKMTAACGGTCNRCGGIGRRIGRGTDFRGGNIISGVGTTEDEKAGNDWRQNL